jgi:predicted small metal-binding protein
VILSPPEEITMSKVMKCGDVVPGCEYVARGQNEDEVLTRAAEHAKRDHGMESIPEDVLKKVKSAIHDE